MQTMGEQGESCPFSFNFDPDTFKVGDTVSYRVPETLGDFPFAGVIKEVHDDHIIICPNDPREPDLLYRATRESRPVVAAKDI